MVLYTQSELGVDFKCGVLSNSQGFSLVSFKARNNMVW